jgi:ATP-dependent RNA helicase DeaD
MLAAPEGTERADAETLLATHDPVAVAAALLRLYRRQLPPAAPVSQAPAAVTQREPRAPGARQADQGGDFVQFRISVGRNNRADPKWLLPLLCRVGNVTKRDIGSIRVFDTDTRFEISRAASEAFAAATADLPPHEPRITQAGDGPMPPAKPFRGKPAGPPHARNGYRNGAASSRRRGPPARG